MSLPLYFALGKSFLENYKNFTFLYLKLLKDQNVDGETIQFVEELTNNLREIIIDYLNGKVASSYSKFKQEMKPVIEKLHKKTIPVKTFYRMRAEGGLSDIKEFHHIPFDKIYLSQNERFSIVGYPCLYLGYSKRVCEIEVSKGSLARFSLKKPLDKILDLTLGQGDGEKDITEKDLVKIYPLIASCYIVPFYSTILEKECTPEKSYFHEEYIIPQLLTLYLKEEGVADGIIYYSVKDPNLNPRGQGEKDFRNIVLFTKREKLNENYDFELIKKFEISL